MMTKRNNSRLTQAGFTLLEILIALFIFTILSLILARALHTVIQTQAVTERRAELLRNLQMALLVFSRDVEQAVNRPILSSNGSESPAFDGSATQFTFTHAGYATAGSVLNHSNLQRATYAINSTGLTRKTWTALDQAPSSAPSTRTLLTDVVKGSFQYLGKDGKFSSKWPNEDETNQPLPQAVKIDLTISGWGDITQLYVIPVQPRQNASPVQAPPTGTQPQNPAMPGQQDQQWVPGSPGQPSNIPTRP